MRFLSHPAFLGAALAVVTCLAPARSEAVELPGDQPHVKGTVRDTAGAPREAATVSLVASAEARVAVALTDAQGRFGLRAPAAGRYVLRVESAGFADHAQVVVVDGQPADDVQVTLSVRPLEETVTVTAHPGSVAALEAVPQSVNVIAREEIDARAKSVIAQVAEGEAGLHLQRTSPTIAAIYVRGLTGNKVNVFVDGMRYSNAAARGGVNTFFDLNDAASLSEVEVLRGPSSTQYGSDAIGGSVQFLTRTPSFSVDGHRLEGAFGSHFNSGDLGFGSDLTTLFSGERFAARATIHGRRVNTLRPGEGLDTHNAVTRFLGLPSDTVIGDRLPDTAFTQYGGSFKTVWALSSSARLTASYRRSQQDGGKRYDQLLGGDGNLVADLRNLMGDLASLRLDSVGTGWFDQVSLAYSFNAQREERVNQGGNGNPTAAINHEPERTTVHGFQGSVTKNAGRHSVTLGADHYREAIDAPSFGFNPRTSAVTVRRGRVPDGARFVSTGVFVQDVFPAAERLDLVGSARWSSATYESRASESPLVSGLPLWPDDDLDVSHPTFRVGASWRPRTGLTLSASASSGFRAPHITDLGTLGLTGSGFEVSSDAVDGLGATVGTTADRNAVSSGDPVVQQKPEKSLGLDASVRWRAGRFNAALAVFVNDIEDNITKQTLILPAGAVGVRLGDQVVTSQLPNGAVFVAASSNPVLVRANFDDARIWGVENTMSLDLTQALQASTVFTYLRAEDRRTGAPPNIEGGTPAPEVWIKLRWAPDGGRWWAEPYARLVGRNDHLSTLDREDRRTGATRSRSSIASFFNNGARARGLIGPGADGIAGNADDVLISTGETVPQVQLRVLGPGVDSAPLFPTIPGFALFGVRGGFVHGRHEVLLDLENLGDKSYRGVSWGIDGPGRGMYVRYRLTF